MSSDSTARNVSQPLSALCGHEDSLDVPVVDRKKTKDAWSLSLAERRASRRLALRLPTHLFFQGQTWKGVTRSLSLGGLSMDFVSDIPAMLNQRMMLSFNPDEGALDSIGIVCGIRSSEDVHVPGRTYGAVTLAIQFIHLSAADERVVAWLLSQGATAPRQMRLAAALVVQEGEESLIDTGSPQTVNTPRPPCNRYEGPSVHGKSDGASSGLLLD
ncbi:MAG: PilZ domain-containing protein [Nitrospira sp.]